MLSRKMLNGFVRFLTGKELALYEDHRQVLPLINDANRRSYIFFPASWLWHPTRIFRHSRQAFRMAYVLLSVIRPAIMLSKNWVIRRDIVYYVWAKKNNKKFIVVQHGAYIGGNVTHYDHRLARCTIFYTWGPHYHQLFQSYNSNNKYCKLIEFGNPIYNAVNRVKLRYPKTIGNKVLFLHSTRSQWVMDQFDNFANQLQEAGFDVAYKMHPKQFKLTEASKIRNISGDVYEILASDHFDIIVSNHSTSLMDALCYKKPVLFFDPEQKKTLYSEHLVNIFEIERSSLTMSGFKELVNLERQETLFNAAVMQTNNTLLV